ncbi:nitrogenase component 1 [Azospirillum argentinense]|uniref:nitrogenase component 1 n=1 Tax=Azospirillum argentinense TaxID=2970906 RepID=UPI0024947083|nr:nitrogenase component 1 [Azospirillum argentinense]
MGTIQRFPHSAKAASTNPLKMSQPLGAALAFLGVDRCMPLFHGSQGCTAFGLVLLVRHFREAIPLQTTARIRSPPSSAATKIWSRPSAPSTSATRPR